MKKSTSSRNLVTDLETLALYEESDEAGIGVTRNICHKGVQVSENKGISWFENESELTSAQTTVTLPRTPPLLDEEGFEVGYGSLAIECCV